MISFFFAACPIDGLGKVKRAIDELRGSELGSACFPPLCIPGTLGCSDDFTSFFFVLRLARADYSHAVITGIRFSRFFLFIIFWISITLKFNMAAIRK